MHQKLNTENRVEIPARHAMKSLLCLSLGLMFVIAGSFSTAAAQDVAFDAYFSDGMVLQRGKANTITGVAPPGTDITVTLAAKSQRTQASESGRWQTTFPPMGPDGVHTLTVQAADAEGVTVRNVEFGDVWLCSGQSNMVWPVQSSATRDKEYSAAEETNIRIMQIDLDPRGSESSIVPVGKPWSVPDERSLASFSASCWAFGKYLDQNVDGPIGLVQAALGATRIEEWLSADALKRVGGMDEELSVLASYSSAPEQALRAFTENALKGAAAYDEGLINTHWYAEGFDDTRWEKIKLPTTWIGSPRSGAPANEYIGVTWFRRSFDMPALSDDAKIYLELGSIDKQGAVWINGELVGSRYSGAVPFRVEVPGNLLRDGANQITVRVADDAGRSGFPGAGQAFGIEVDGQLSSLAGFWRYRIGADRRAMGELDNPPWAPRSGIQILWNGMIAPLTDKGIKGVAWYQGESNSRSPESYNSLLAALVDSWRGRFDSQDMPVIIAQLPVYGGLVDRSGDSGWADIREAQRQVYLNRDNVGLAVLLDLGVRTEIHPAHKEEVGLRLGREALRIAYGGDIQPPAMPVGGQRDGGALLIRFGPGERQLRAIGGNALIGFETCNAQWQCRYARAVLLGDGATVRVAGLREEDVYLRYGWSASPLTNLYEEEDIPVSPFRFAMPDE
ncbi:hypothetical protein FF098_000570 [Parvularcula flava]|uniref:9-O-acetylesterase n=1 Tax=Aquisalinus luteolus TaxID=1566827 RepID=A0A8J3EPQ3_9PROT|nr:sialate O-acetylesterase [Aquisalinus luteolus]NHK26394.1 hypothetical protein [Aquisalinus luteolus]GGH92205.1 9-O-acetylesterase [Aquisalinus luteolus]